ncbi:small ribosomal subunit biogenesis GTPase RsgA [Tumidithrix helvetica PCC 7403]|uniref:small ribosomal subunit biogenesis GTPase RsgA n=1 Tax=Tumidithrix helvetica TaxID=3457545 RepID=UPI003CB5EBFF
MTTNQIENLTGTVLAVQANFYRVSLDRVNLYALAAIHGIEDSSIATKELLCTRRARLKKIGQQICVGDRVVIQEPDWQGNRGAIAEVAPRHNLLDRPPIANVDRVLLVFALADPEIELLQLSRFLVNIEASDLDIVLCLNKCDLVTEAERQTWCDRMQNWGYAPIAISTYTGEGIAQLKQHLSTGVTVAAGPSGVGKSSLINFLIPELKLRVGEVSQRLGHGRHTTRHVELFPLDDRATGYLADTPGFLQPALPKTPMELAYCFPEARQRLASGTCQFNDCLHRDEPNCVVQGDWERYAHYSLFLDDVEAYYSKARDTTKTESTLKTKSGTGGQVQHEPRLVTKKHRRTSRRTDLQKLDFDIENDNLNDDFGSDLGDRE